MSPSPKEKRVDWALKWVNVMWPFVAIAITLWVSREIHAKRLDDLDAAVSQIRTDAATESITRIRSEKEFQTELTRGFERMDTGFTDLSRAIGRIEGEIQKSH